LHDALHIRMNAHRHTHARNYHGNMHALTQTHIHSRNSITDWFRDDVLHSACSA